jgi:uncharacterized protein YecE (DUF72 family)
VPPSHSTAPEDPDSGTLGTGIGRRAAGYGPAVLHIGVSGWTYRAWRGDFYPSGLVQRRELAYMSRRLTSIEINGSFYSLQRPSSWERWRAEVPEGFVFAVKGSRFVTHLRRLREPRVPLANFFAQGVLGLGDALGPILWQLPATQAWEEDLVGEFLALLPRTTGEAAELALQHDDRLVGDKLWSGEVVDRPLVHVLEPRHRGFAAPEALAQLEQAGVGLVVADSAEKFPRFEQAQGPVVYVRLHGDVDLYVSGYGDEALDRWAEKIRGWTADGRDAFVYFDNDAKVRAPYDALALLERFSSA